MPRLINLENEFSVKEYFPEAYWSSSRNKWQIDIPTEYPFRSYIHKECENKRILKEIRLYVEKHGEDDVFYQTVDKSYSHCWNKGTVSSWDESWDRINNHYWEFNFGSRRDYSFLLIKYSGLFVLETPEFHPEYYWHTPENTRRW